MTRVGRGGAEGSELFSKNSNCRFIVLNSMLYCSILASLPWDSSWQLFAYGN
jgi:hypothetical protein